MKKENIHFFTFGYGHDLSGCCQPIIADSPELARQVMIDKYDSKWAFQYTYKEYMQSRKEGYAREELLTPIKVTVKKAKK